MTKFKVGDICKPTNPNACGSFQSKRDAKYIKITKIVDGGYYYYILDKNFQMISSCEECFKDENLESTKKGKSQKNKNISYIVIWDKEDEDPVQKIYSLIELREFIENLISDPDVEKDSIEWFKVVKSGKPKIIIDLGFNPLRAEIPKKRRRPKKS